jgi:predicted alternative tryptophan synthase beta-subunit
VLNHVLLHQTIIGLEAKKQPEKAGERSLGCTVAYPKVPAGAWDRFAKDPS